jgi:hypothetical protein
MLPFHGDVAARIGQLPFVLLGAVSLSAIARRCGVRPAHAAYAPLFFLLARPVVEQAVGADVDLICAAMFVASLYLGIVRAPAHVARDRGLRRDHRRTVGRHADRAAAHFCEFGAGDVDLAPILQRLARQGYASDFIVEYEDRSTARCGCTRACNAPEQPPRRSSDRQ